jgi:hypothetical protein
VERHGGGVREFHIESGEAGKGADAVQHAVDGGFGSGDGAVQSLMGHQQCAAHLGPAQGLKLIANRLAVGDGREPVEGGHAQRHGRRRSMGHHRAFA